MGSSGYRSEETGSRTDSILFRLVEALANHEGVDKTELDPPLGTVVDVDALERLFAPDGGDGHVWFSYDGYEVRVESDGEIRVADPVERQGR